MADSTPGAFAEYRDEATVAALLRRRAQIRRGRWTGPTSSGLAGLAQQLADGIAQRCCSAWPTWRAS
jgi:hypothetical protein